MREREKRVTHLRQKGAGKGGGGEGGAFQKSEDQFDGGGNKRKRAHEGTHARERAGGEERESKQGLRLDVD